MKLAFTSPLISSYSHGNQVFENTGEPIEVPAASADGFLQARARVDGERVNVFEIVDAQDASAEASNEEDDFEVDLMSLTRAQLDEMAASLGLNGSDYPNKAEIAAAIKAAQGD